MKNLYYTLDENKNPVPTDMWGFAQSHSQIRHVKNDKVEIDGVKIHISTVFLGMDHGWGDEKPVLFETMIFGGEHNDYQERYHTWAEAEEGHKRAMELVFS